MSTATEILRRTDTLLLDGSPSGRACRPHHLTENAAKIRRRALCGKQTKRPHDGRQTQLCIATKIAMSYDNRIHEIHECANTSSTWIYHTTSRIHDADHYAVAKIYSNAHTIPSKFAPFITLETPIRLYRNFIKRLVVIQKFREPESEISGYDFDFHWIGLFHSKHIYPSQQINFENELWIL